MHHHPFIESPDQLQRPTQSAAAMGYRMPAEWEPLDRVWLTYPHNPYTWPTVLDKAKSQYDAFLAALGKFTTPYTTQTLELATNDSWIRDYGPIFVVNDKGGLACHDFIFNCWGGKYDEHDLDNVIPQHIARQLNIPIWVHDVVMEGGGLDVNGRGTLLTTEQCLLNENRNPHLTRQQIEQVLADALNVRQFIWLPGGIEGDDTDGHIDDVARFIAPDTVAAVRPPAGHPDHHVLEQNWQILARSRDQDGNLLNLVELPAPDPIYFDYPADEYSDGGRRQIPASYANFLIANGGVLAPIFGQKHDDAALRSLERAMPRHQIVPIRAEWLVVGLGTLHCMSQQQPRVATK
jgi:agmatine deiminase